MVLTPPLSHPSSRCSPFFWHKEQRDCYVTLLCTPTHNLGCDLNIHIPMHMGATESPVFCTNLKRRITLVTVYLSQPDRASDYVLVICLLDQSAHNTLCCSQAYCESMFKCFMVTMQTHRHSILQTYNTQVLRTLIALILVLT